jgi:soluble lytic murein transglycosylase
MITCPLMKSILIAGAIVLSACSAGHDASASGDVADPPDRELAQALQQSDVLSAAQTAIDRGHPWQATRVVAPLLRDAQKRTPAALLVAARAAAGWDGWPEVEKLLVREGWIDSRFDGEGRELLARAALERNADTAAVTQATLALRDAKTAQQRAIRSVYLARALERSNYFDSAAVMYLRAGETLRPVRDWLALRAAGTQKDSAARARSFALVRSTVAKARVPWTEAQARERSQDALGAAARYASLGATVPSLRLRLSVAPDSVTRQTIRNELLAFIRSHSGTADARSAVDVLDRGFTSLAPAEELIIARSAAASGPPSRAVVAFERALSQPGLITPADRIQYAQVLSRVNRSRDALAQLALVQGPLAGQAAYQRARVFLTSGTADQTRAALRDVVARFPGDTGAAASALYLLADLSTDAGDDDQARSLYQQLYRSYPSSSRAADARFRAGVIDYVKGDPRAAAAAWDSVVARYPRADDASASRYWAGRAYAATGDEATARLRWRDAIGTTTVSYYGMLAAKRLGESPWAPPARADEFQSYADIDSAFARIALLDRLGMDVESRFELDAIDDAAGTTPERIAATAHAMLAHNQSSRAIRLGQKLVDAGQRDTRSYRLVYPLVDREELTRAAKANGLDPWLVAGLIRQESSFNPRAISAANARGLMQVLPSVGEEVARSLRYPVWYPVLLLDADANLELGTAHLAAYTKQYGPLPRVLAAYNAGGSRVTRWSSKTGMDDPEVFAERIPYVETRDYVRIVQRNQAVYRSL